MGTPSIVSLVTDYVAALKRWITDVRELAAVELSAQLKKAGMGVALFLGAAFFGVIAFGLITFGLVYLLVEVVGLSTWLSFVLVAVLYLVIAGILALVGKKLVSALVGPKRTIAAVKAGPGFPLGGAPEDAPAVDR